MNPISETLFAHALLKPEDSASEKDSSLISQNVNVLKPATSALVSAAKVLQAYGFEVIFENEYTLLISGGQELFEDVFRSKITEVRGVFHFDNDTFRIPDAAAMWIETVSFSEPPPLFT